MGARKGAHEIALLEVFLTLEDDHGDNIHLIRWHETRSEDWMNRSWFMDLEQCFIV